LVFSLSDVLQPGFPYTVETLDHTKVFTLRNASTESERVADISFKFNDIKLSGRLDFTHLDRSNLDAELEFDGENKKVYKLVNNSLVKITLTLRKIEANTGPIPLEVGADLTLTGKIKPLDIERSVDISLNLEFGVD
jgi:hypothetical protein